MCDKCKEQQLSPGFQIDMLKLINHHYPDWRESEEELAGVITGIMRTQASVLCMHFDSLTDDELNEMVEIQKNTLVREYKEASEMKSHLKEIMPTLTEALKHALDKMKEELGGESTGENKRHRMH